jgi:hypothetical protein
LSLPDTEAGIACKGTAAERATIKVNGKAFLFLGSADAMLKLQDSVRESEQFAAQLPAHCKPGKGGWTSLKFGDAAVPLDVLKRWVSESYQLFAGTDSKAVTRKKSAAPKKVKTK